MVDNYIYVDENGAEKEAETPLQQDMRPYEEGMGVQQGNGVNTATYLSEPIAIPSRPIYQAAVNKESNEYIQALSDARNMLANHEVRIKTELSNYYDRQLKEYYMGERDPEDPRKLKYPERPLPPTMDQVNKELENRKSGILDKVTSHLDISDPDVKASLYEQFNLKYLQTKQNITSTVIKHEAKAAKDSYDHYGKSLTQEAKLNPGSRLPDLKDQYTESVAAGVNRNVLTPEEGVGKIQQVTGALKKEKQAQLKEALRPQENVTPDVYAEKAQILLKDNVEQGVITPQEAQNWYGESISQSLVANNSQYINTQKQAVVKVAETKAQAVELDLKAKSTIDALRNGIAPDPGTIQDLYTNAPEPMRQKLDEELGRAFSVAKFSILPKDLRTELLANPDLLSSVFYLNDEQDLKALQDQNDVLNESAAKDPVAMVLQQKFIDGVPPVDYSTDDKLVTSLRSRAVLSSRVYAQTGVENIGLTQAEIDSMGKQYANGSIGEKAKILGMISNAYGDSADLLYQKLDEKGYKSLALAGSYYHKENRVAGVDIVNGIELLKQNPGLIPTDAKLQANLKEMNIDFPTFYDNINIPTSDGSVNPTTGGEKQRIIAAAKYIYASKLAKEGIIDTNGTGKGADSADFKKELFQESLNEAMNGGPIKVGRSFISPPAMGIDKAKIDKFLSNIKPEDVAHIKQLNDVVKRVKDPGLIQQGVNKATKSNELTKTLLEDTEWVDRGDGTYVIGLRLGDPNDPVGTSKFTPFTDQNGKLLIFNLRDMMRDKSKPDYNDVPHVVPQYNDILGQVGSSEAAAREWSKIRQRELETPGFTPDPALANFTMSGNGTSNPTGEPWK